MDLDERLIALFWSKVDKAGGPIHPEHGRCWTWNAGRFSAPDNYGGFAIRRRVHKAHRVAFTIANGRIADGLCVLHRCDNPPCVRPDHLFLGTNRDNTADMVSKGRKAPSGGAIAPDRQPRGMRHGRARLTDDDVRAMRARLDAGESVAAIRQSFGICESLVYKIRHRLNWTHV